MCLLTWHGVAAAEEATLRWERADVPADEAAFVSIETDTARSQVVAATRRAVYLSDNTGEGWAERFRVPAGATIQDVAVNTAASGSSVILVATDRGVYGSFDGADHWTRLATGIGEGESDCTVVRFHPTRAALALLGTRGGLFVSRDAGRRWSEVQTPDAATNVVDLAPDPNDPDRLHLATPHEVVSGRLPNGPWQRHRSLVLASSGAEDVPDPDAEESEEPPRRLSAIAIAPGSPPTWYVGLTDGAMVSRDGGTTWRPLSTAGLLSASISRLLVPAQPPPALYAATAKGVACYEPGRDAWQVLTDGLATTKTHDLAATALHLWAATEEGLYRAQIAAHAAEAAPGLSPAEAVLARFADEPTIRQVQEAAIRYAEVHPQKIWWWRRQARLSALVPKLSFTGDTNLTDFRHWDSGTNPDSLLRGERDLDWSGTITWELADLIWSDAQTSIDNRSKLMVQLRDDIVDEVTRLYFERRRLQVALLERPPRDQKTALKQELRLQELTAMIDGLTGGYLSTPRGRRQAR